MGVVATTRFRKTAVAAAAKSLHHTFLVMRKQFGPGGGEGWIRKTSVPPWQKHKRPVSTERHGRGWRVIPSCHGRGSSSSSSSIPLLPAAAPASRISRVFRVSSIGNRTRQFF